jgi:hypothetical protein
MPVKQFISALGMFVLTISFASAEVTYTAKGITYKVQGNRVVELSGLSSPCDPNSTRIADFQGTVVKRNFASDQIRLTGFVIELADGSRDYINVYDLPEDLGRLDLSWIVPGLQTLL